jgi:hypothetical protein
VASILDGEDIRIIAFSLVEVRVSGLKLQVKALALPPECQNAPVAAGFFQ